ncbi:MAG: DUF835 domain-containing protein [Candidatus Nanohaloarchaea archaeon]|nr:DUF835 domain-containing protein [Candidatus Nanohaloarchaea archaeon]
MSAVGLLQGITSPFILFMDYWVLVVTVLVLAYLLGRFPEFEKKEVATTYVLFMSLFVFWSLRNLANKVFEGSVPFYVDVFSLLLDFAVMAFSAHLFLHFWRKRDVRSVLQRLDLQAGIEEEPQHSHATEEEGASSPDIREEYEDMEPGYAYLILEQGTEYGFQLFRQGVTETPGLCFSRKYPEKIKKRHELEETPVFWFTEREDVEDERTVEPFRLNFLEETMTSFIEKNIEEDNGSIILMDGVEYLMFKNPFEKFIDFIEDLVDHISDKPDVTLLLTMEEDSLSDRKLSLLKEEFDEVRRVDEDGNVDRRHY